MALQIGSTNFGHIYVGSIEIAEAYFGSIKVFPDSTPVLPVNTLRLKYSQGYTPSFGSGTSVCIDQQNNIWDWTNTQFTASNIDPANLIEVVDGNVVTTNGLFQTFSEITSLLSVKRLYAPNTKNLNAIFRGCTALQTVARFQPSTEIYEAIALFGSCSSLQSVNLFDTHTMTLATSMFSQCSSLETIPAFDFSNCTNIDTAFRGCNSLLTIPNFDLSNVVTMQSTFEGCESLAAIPSLNLSKVENMEFAFGGCRSLQAIPAITVSVVDNCRGSFSHCSSVTTGALNMYNAFVSQSTQPTNHSSTFSYCGSDTISGQAELAQIPTSWGGTGA